ncbi:hypothetical protein V6N13_104680 [Hibiscus sabdariffa]|uniref:Uncharacterized protein n=2 Tax=Hibiscus sabdariffa TaxID=183260 RepID=A0ABR2P9K9_9ROSI
MLQSYTNKEVVDLFETFADQDNIGGIMIGSMSLSVDEIHEYHPYALPLVDEMPRNQALCELKDSVLSGLGEEEHCVAVYLNEGRVAAECMKKKDRSRSKSVTSQKPA